MAIPLNPKHTVSFEELLTSRVVQQEALTRLLVEKGIFKKEEFLEMVRVVDQEMKGERSLPKPLPHTHPGVGTAFLFQRKGDE
jgi:hypothetical protein